MSTPESHDLKHQIIERDVGDLKDESKLHRGRLELLEQSDKLLGYQMESTMHSIESLIGWIKWGLGFAIVSYFSFFAWLLQQRLL